MARTAPIGNPIPSDQDSPNELKPIYSQNRLTNGDADKGMAGWQSQGVGTVAGGAEESANAFKFNPLTASMSQSVSAQGNQPADYRVGGYYLPDKQTKAADVKVKAYVQVEYLYADGTKDVTVVPVRGAVAYE